MPFRRKLLANVRVKFCTFLRSISAVQLTVMSRSTLGLALLLALASSGLSLETIHEDVTTDDDWEQPKWCHGKVQST